MTTTQNTHTTKVTMRNGFESVIITFNHTREDLPEFIVDAEGKPVGVNMVEGDVYRVTVVGLYATTHGHRVGDVREFSFGDIDDARAKANGWFASLIRKGYVRVA